MGFSNIDLFFADKRLTEFFKITDIKNEMMNKEIFSTVIPGSDGELFMGQRNGAKLIEVEFLIESDNVIEVERQLAPFLDMAEPSKLKFSNESDKFYYAIVDGKVQTELITHRHSKGKIIFRCLDPYAYAENPKIFTMDANNRITIVNDGTANTQVIYRANITGDCGFLSIASTEGSILYGNRKEVDGYTPPRSERILSDSLTSVSGWTQNSGQIMTPGATYGGSIASIGGNFVPTGFGTGSTWHGSTISKDLSTASENFTAVIHFDYGTTGSELSKGILEMSFLDENNEVMFGQRIKDGYEGTECAVPSMFVGNVMKYEEKNTVPNDKKIRKYNKTTKKYETKIVQGDDVGVWNNLYGTLEVSKMGSIVRFKLTKRDQNGKVLKVMQKSFNLTSTQKAKKLKKVNFWFGQWKTDTPIYMAVKSVLVTKHNATKYIDIPNTLQNGDELVIDSEQSQVYLNGSLAMEDLSPQSRFHESEPGTMVVRVMASNYANVSVTAEIRERFK